MKKLLIALLGAISFSSMAQAGLECSTLEPVDPKFPKSGSKWYPLVLQELSSESLLQCPTMIAGKYGFIYSLDKATSRECRYKRGSIKAKCKK
ncbi:MAG: hypothetical protein CL678_10635 [Bdellovibrionaceae bacterium]|nr:hypothetical protein [Pseudobdellovibrionaceae bacterium]|tara:strand:+ start:1678 stop:1956 length:279 start_codon:yes stop_codon:yes gene_type:complete